MGNFISFMWGEKTCSRCFKKFEGNINSHNWLCPKCSRRFIRTKKVYSVVKKIVVGIKDFITGNY